MNYRLFSVVFLTGLVYGCGGGELLQTVKVPSPLAIPPQEAVAVSAPAPAPAPVVVAPTVPSVTSSVVTGRVLPPDPGPTAQIPLAGIDSNSNGVRDEVERAISALTRSDSSFEKANAVARELQTPLAPSGTNVDRGILSKNVYCLDRTRTSAEKALLPLLVIESLVFDTQARRDRLANLGGLNNIQITELATC
jgi:hypothetical protein